MLQNLEGFMYATSLDFWNLGYSSYNLTPNASRLCTVVLPWGKYEYLVHPWDYAIVQISSKRNR
jgi:hypothetical protein